MSKGGRPPKLTPDLLRQAEELSASVVTLTDFAEALGIARYTLQTWRQQGISDIARGEQHTLHARFSVIATRVPDNGEVAISSNLIRIATSSPSESVPAAAIVSAAKVAMQLVYKRPMPAQGVELSGPGGGPIHSQSEHTIDLSKLTRDELRNLHALTLKAAQPAVEHPGDEATPGE